MGLIIDTTAGTEESAAWTPTADVAIQMDGASGDGNRVRCQIMARVSDTAPWIPVGTISENDPIIRLAQMPFMKVIMTDNNAGNAVKVWNNE